MIVANHIIYLSDSRTKRIYTSIYSTIYSAIYSTISKIWGKRLPEANNQAYIVLNEVEFWLWLTSLLA